jgi:hypothetical protein
MPGSPAIRARRPRRVQAPSRAPTSAESSRSRPTSGPAACASAASSRAPLGGCRRRRRFDGSAAIERCVLPENRALELLKLAARLDAELVDEHAPRVLVHAQRLGLPSGAVEGEHELSPEALAQGVLRHERLELADELRLPTRGEVGLEAILARREAQLVEARDLRLSEGLVGKIGQRRPAPERERLAQERRRLRRVAPGERAASLVAQTLEATEVELFAFQPQLVTRAARQDEAAGVSGRTIGFQELAKCGHVSL